MQSPELLQPLWHHEGSQSWDKAGALEGRAERGKETRLKGNSTTEPLNQIRLELRSPLSFSSMWTHKWTWKWSCSLVSNSMWRHEWQPTRLCRPWDFPGKNTGVSCHFLLQGMFPTQGSNPGLLHCRQMLYPLSHQGSHRFSLFLKSVQFGFSISCN